MTFSYFFGLYCNTINNDFFFFCSQINIELLKLIVLDAHFSQNKNYYTRRRSTYDIFFFKIISLFVIWICNIVFYFYFNFYV